MIRIVAMLLLLTVAANAAPLAKSDRSLWPHPLNSPELFDFASKMEMLVFAKHIKAADSMDEAELRAWLGLNSVNMDSVRRYSAEMKTRLLKNMVGIAQHSNDWVGDIKSACDYDKINEIVASGGVVDGFCVTMPRNTIEWQKLKSLSLIQQVELPEQYKAWYADANSFYAAYAYEQYRLAALFPKITSEILKVNSKEFRGDEQEDKRFILTFDDGPGKYTTNTLAALRKANKTGIFFILGDSLQAQHNLDTLYAGMTRGIHGTKHEALTKPEHWQKLPAFIKAVSSENCWFRPPYGQRTAEFAKFLDEQDCKLMLWNIDSQDWQKDMTAAEMQDRLTSLILLWRSGIILFHDVHPKAAQTLPELWQRFDGAGIQWE